MQQKDLSDYEIVEIYLPTVPDDDAKRAESRRWEVWDLYHFTEDDCLMLLRSQRTIFDRLMHIDPTLRRPKPGGAPFATRLVYPTKCEAKNALQKIHACFDRYGVNRDERRTYLYALTLLCLLDMHIVQAKVQLLIDHPSQQ